MKERPVKIEVIYNANITKVWRAITNNSDIKQWYFPLAEFRPEVGFMFQFYGEGKKGNKYLHLCEITEVVDKKKLTYSWRYDNYPGNSLVTFELFEKEKQTQLKLTHNGLETFPENNPDFALENFVAGWTYFTGTALKTFLEKTAD